MLTTYNGYKVSISFSFNSHGSDIRLVRILYLNIQEIRSLSKI